MIQFLNDHEDDVISFHPFDGLFPYRSKDKLVSVSFSTANDGYAGPAAFKICQGSAGCCDFENPDGVFAVGSTVEYSANALGNCSFVMFEVVENVQFTLSIGSTTDEWLVDNVQLSFSAAKYLCNFNKLYTPSVKESSIECTHRLK